MLPKLMPKCARPQCKFEARSDSRYCGRHKWGYRTVSGTIEENIAKYAKKRGTPPKRP